MKALLVAFALSASSAGALTFSEMQTPRRFLLEVKLGPYLPAIDRGFDTNGPFKATFGDRLMLLGEVDFGVEVFQGFGVAAVGVSVGFSEIYGRSRVVDGTVAPEETVSQGTGFHVVPIKFLAQYRFDYLYQRWGVPIVPYVRGGFVLMPWWATNGANVETAQNAELKSSTGQGLKTGIAGCVGLSIPINFLSQRMARDLDSATGINTTYVFAEGWLQDVTNFGGQSAKALNLSSLHATFGLGFEF
jgi:hypothetical protein